MITIPFDELSSRARDLLDSGEAVIVMRDGDPVAVMYPIRDSNDIPMEVRRKRFLELSAKIGAQIPPNVTDEDIERDFAEHKKRSRGR